MKVKTDNAIGEASTTFRVNSWPTGGLFFVTPERGIATYDEFTFKFID